jgi:adenine-specific DNA-methyltransferase
MYAAQYAEPLTVAFLDSQPHLVLDTSLFDSDFTERLLATFDDVEGSTDGVLIESENFQALNLLQARYREQIKCIYIDPPYNTNASEILYKNGYKNSSWLSLIENRIGIGASLLKTSGAMSIAIDDYELTNLSMLIEQVLPNYEIQKVIVNHYPGSGTGRSNVSRTHEYNLFVLPIGEDVLRGKERESGLRERNFRRSGTGENNYRTGRPNSFFAVLVDSASYEIKGIEEPPTTPNYPRETTKEGWARIYPFGEDGSERVWSLSYEGAVQARQKDMLLCTRNLVINRLYADEKARDLIQSVWLNKKFNATTFGTNLLTDMFGNSGLFSYPKSLFTVSTAIDAVAYDGKQSIILDFFAGSGTTAHAVINLNREDGGTRKFILVEMGEYFHTVTKPRVLKVIYSKDWRDGKPVSRIGSSCMVKSLRLESYEDTLNNLRVTPRPTQQQDLLAAHDAFRESYTLRYLFERDTAESPSLLNLDAFENPFDYRLDVSEAGSSAARVSTPVDLIETFNYLLGLRVTRRRTLEDFRIVEGSTLDGARTLIIWRNIQTQDNDALNRFFQAQDFAAQGFQTIYANGDHTLGMTRRDGETWQDRMIEADFKRLMFEEQV